MEGTEGTPAVQRRQVSTIQRAAASLSSWESRESSWESRESYIIPGTNYRRNKDIVSLQVGKNDGYRSGLVTLLLEALLFLNFT